MTDIGWRYVTALVPKPVSPMLFLLAFLLKFSFFSDSFDPL